MAPAPAVVEITDPRVVRDGTRLYTTLEGDNPSGSLKDRMVGGELRELLASGRLSAGDRVAEVSAGNTARSLAWHGRALGLVVDLFVPDVLPPEEIDSYAAMGATVHTGDRETGMALYEEFCAREQPYQLNQMGDASLARHYNALGAGVVAEAGHVGLVVGAVGTGHSLLGTAEGITPRPTVVSAEPAEAFAMLGVRNVDLERYGPQDPCTPELFDQRIVVPADDRTTAFPDGVVDTTVGPVDGGAALGLVLAATQRLLAEDPASDRVLVIGATARRRDRAKG